MTLTGRFDRTTAHARARALETLSWDPERKTMAGQAARLSLEICNLRDALSPYVKRIGAVIDAVTDRRNRARG